LFSFSNGCIIIGNQGCQTHNIKSNEIDDQRELIDKGDKYKTKISNEEQSKLLEYHPEIWWSSWAQNKDYQKPSGRKMADVIIYTLKVFWFVTALVVIFQFIFDC
jgi:hypothetical protein